MDHQVVASALGIRPVLAKAGDRAINQTGVDGLQAGVVQTVMRQTADLEVLYKNIALQGQLANQRLAFGLGYVDGHRAFVAIARREVTGVRGVMALRVL